MQEETNEKTIALYIKTGKLTAQQLQKAMKALLAQMKKQHDKQKIPHGKQTLKQLMKQNAGVSNIEITKDNGRHSGGHYQAALWEVFLYGGKRLHAGTRKGAEQ